jgi:hypothetical protein
MVSYAGRAHAARLERAKNTPSIINPARNIISKHIEPCQQRSESPESPLFKTDSVMLGVLARKPDKIRVTY